MADTPYTPPKVWKWEGELGGRFGGINRPTAGAREHKVLPVGDHPFQLYSLGTPNGQKVTIMFEELLEAGFAGAEYDAWMINIMESQQFGSGFVEINPNSKIPALVDHSGEKPFRIFESGAILIHLAEKFDFLLPHAPEQRAETLSWLMWQMGSAPFLGGGFGHFYAYAPIKIEYAIDRYALEAKRLFDVANQRLAQTRFLAGDDYSIADIAAYPWLGMLYRGEAYNNGAEFLSLHEYEHVGRWVKEIGQRPGAIRGSLVNSAKGIPERHAAADFNILNPELLKGV